MSIYRGAFEPQNVKGPGDGRPTAQQIIRDEGAEGRDEGKVMFLTGSSSGIGIETARALAATGATIFLGVRDLEKAARVHADILSPKVQLVKLDVTQQASIRAAAADLLRRSNGRLNILINNAGVLAPPQFHINGQETHMVVHYWGPFLLFQLLKDALLQSATAEYPSRVVNVASKAHQAERIDFEDLHLPGKDSVFDGYQRSRLAEIYMTSEIERRYGASGLHGYSLDPGVVREGSEIDRHVADLLREKWADPILQGQLMSAAQGSATTIWAALSKEALGDGVRGKYLEFCWPAPPAAGILPGMEGGYGKWAYDVEDAKRLWDLSFDVVGLDTQ
ncbi:short-chain dehydrogenase [Xylariales sp. PMI_506]|nr:short-chain dehydrogenase [Xylariales sp. PMI_506]